MNTAAANLLSLNVRSLDDRTLQAMAEGADLAANFARTELARRSPRPGENGYQALLRQVGDELKRLGHCTPLLGGHSVACDRDGRYCSKPSSHTGPCEPHGRS